MSLIKKIILTALFTAMVFVITMFAISIPLGYLNIGDALIMLLATVLPIPMIAFIGGVGSMMADVSLGYAEYALFTLLIKSSEGVLVAFLYKNLKGWSQRTLPFIAAGLWIMIWYGLTDVFLKQSWPYFWVSMAYNSLQGIGSAIIAIALIPAVTRIMRRLWKV